MDYQEAMIFGGFTVGFAGLGAATTIAVEKIATKYGRVFQQYNCHPEFGVKSTVLIGVIGAVQCLASIIMTLVLSEKHDSEAKFLGKLVISSIACGVALAALTALAAKTNLVASQFTLFGGFILITNSAIMNLLTIYLFTKIAED